MTPAASQTQLHRSSRPLAARLGERVRQLRVAAGYLANGVSVDERGRIEAALTRAEALTEAHRYEEAVAEYENVRPAIAATASTELEVRTIAGEAWARMQQ